MSKSVRNIINWVIMLGLMFGFGFIPPFGGDITPLGMRVLGIFLGLLYGWCGMEFLPVSFIAVTALGLTDYTTVLGAFGMGFTAEMTLMILCLLIIVGYLEDSGLPKFITSWFMTRQILKGKPYLLFAMIFICIGVLMALGLSLGAIFLVWVILYRMFDMLGYKKGDKIVPYLLFGVVFCGTTANSIPHFQIFPVVVINLLEETLPNYTVPVGGWWLFYLIFYFACMLVYLAFGKFVLRLDVERFKNCDDLLDDFKKDLVMNTKQKIAGVSVIIFIAIVLLPSMLPDSWAITQFLAKFGVIGAAVVIMAIAALIRIKGEPITDWDDNARRGINWGLLSMFVATAPVSAALESDEAGIVSTLTTSLTPILDGLPVFAFYFISLFLLWAMTQFAHNLVLAMVLTPTLCQFCVMVGGNPLVLIAGISACAQAAYATPGASSPGAVFHGNSEWLTPKQAYFYGISGSLLGFLVFIVLIPVAELIF